MTSRKDLLKIVREQEREAERLVESTDNGPSDADRPRSKAGTSGKDKASHADLLVALAQEAELWHTPDGTAFATIPCGDHRETHMIRRKGFRGWLLAQFYQTHGKAPSANALQAAINTLEGIAIYGGDEHQSHIRLAGLDGCIYLDLGRPEWNAVEITAAGWRVLAEPPVRFHRGRAMLALPIPERGGSLDALRPFLNVESETDFRLLLSVLAAYTRPRGPFPLLVLQGEQGSAKSTTARIIKSLIDPSKASLRTRPRDETDLIISANHGYILAFDNLSAMPDYLSDGLCRLATGGGLAKRELYTDSDEVVLEALRPVIVNGIADVVVRDDLRDRAVVLTLPTIPDTARRDEERFWQAFEAAQPQLLGALLDATCAALAGMATVKLPAPPRMADFARWAVAAAPALGWTPEAFLYAYTGNRVEAVLAVVEGDPVAQVAIEIGDFTGTATELLVKMNALATDQQRSSKGWPADGTRLAGRLRRLAPGLRLTGTIITFMKTTGGKRLVSVRRVDRADSATTATSATLSTAESGASGAEGRRSGAESDASGAVGSTGGASGAVSPMISPPPGAGDAWEPE